MKLEWDRIGDPVALLHSYGLLHDGLSDMIESGRLSEADIPDDYQWLVNTLEELGAHWNLSKDKETN